MALPSGAAVQLRYRREWVEPALASAVERGDWSGTPLVGWRVLYGYVDASSRDREPIVVPLRYGSLLSAENLGPAFSLRVAMGDVVGDHDAGAFNASLRVATADLPRWESVGGQTTMRGAFCLRFPTAVAPPREAGPPVAGPGLDAWEARVRELGKRADFAARRVFYVVEGIRGPHGPARVEEGRVQLRPGRGYDVRVYHVAPSDRDSVPPHPTLQVQSSSDEVRVVTPPLIADSAYDVKTVRLRTGRPATSDEGVLVVVATDVEAQSHPEGGTPAEEGPRPSGEVRAFEVPVQLSGTVTGKLAAAGLIGTALTAQALILLRDELPGVGAIVAQLGPWGVLALVVVLNLAIGGTVAFGLKRTV